MAKIPNEVRYNPTEEIIDDVVDRIKPDPGPIPNDPGSSSGGSKHIAAVMPTWKNAVNFDFGADYGRMAVENYSNGHYAWGTLHMVDGICEAAYDTVIMEFGLLKFFGFSTGFFARGGGAIVAAEAAAKGGIGFKSFRAFKKVFGPAGEGKAWHHIVEQNPLNLSKFGPEMIHNTNNLIKLPSGAGSIHARISGFYSSIQPRITGSTTMTVRQWLSTKSFEFQYDFGIQKLTEFGWNFK